MNKYLIIPIAIIIIVFIGVITSLFKKEDVNNMIDMKFDNISEIDIDTNDRYVDNPSTKSQYFKNAATSYIDSIKLKYKMSQLILQLNKLK